MRSYRARSRGDAFYLLGLIFSVLEKYLNESDMNRSVRETCETATAKVEWDHLRRGKDISPEQPPSLSQWPSHPSVRCLIDFIFFAFAFAFADPVPPTSGLLAGRAGTATVSNIEALLSRFLYTQLSLFERYQLIMRCSHCGSLALLWPLMLSSFARGFSAEVCCSSELITRSFSSQGAY